MQLAHETAPRPIRLPLWLLMPDLFARPTTLQPAPPPHGRPRRERRAVQARARRAARAVATAERALARTSWLDPEHDRRQRHVRRLRRLQAPAA